MIYPGLPNNFISIPGTGKDPFLSTGSARWGHTVSYMIDTRALSPEGMRPKGGSVNCSAPSDEQVRAVVTDLYLRRPLFEL